MILPRVRIHKFVWNGNDGEVWYTNDGGAVNYLRALLDRFGFHFGAPISRPGGDDNLRALPVVKRGCSLTELQHVCRNDPWVAIGPRAGEETDAAKGTTPLLRQGKEDLSLAEDVERALCATGYGPLRDIDVTAYAHLVILGGRVPSYYLKQVAQTTALAVPGARHVRNDLDVSRPT
jgi:hypothetical protein